MRKEPRFKICAYLSENIWSSPKCLNFKRQKWQRLQLQPLGVSKQSFAKREAHLQPNRRLYGMRLRAKQRFRKYYGNITEKQFKTLYKNLSKKNDMPGVLESRLDVCIYRMNFVPTIFAARQLINHGGILVNGLRVDLKGYLLNPGDVIEIKRPQFFRLSDALLDRLKINTFFLSPPKYLEVDYKTLIGIFIRRPSMEEIPYPIPMNFELVKEFYRFLK
jgi:small subunit ribosomal protein S4|tara:strand:- start:85 stop:741 length:657 start_codon:yes stop_codon:yes gene_type:complete